MIEEPTVQLNKFSKTKCKKNSKLQYLRLFIGNDNYKTKKNYKTV